MNSFIEFVLGIFGCNDTGIIPATNAICPLCNTKILERCQPSDTICADCVFTYWIRPNMDGSAPDVNYPDFKDLPTIRYG